MMTEDNKNYYIKLITESLVNDPEIYNAIREMHNSAIQLQNTLVQRLPYNITKTIFQNTISNVINTIKPAISEASSDNEQSNVSHTNENAPAVSTDTIQTDTEQTQTIINEPQSETIKTNTVKTTKNHLQKKTDWSKSPDLSLRQAFARHKRAGKPIEPELLAELIKRFPGFAPEKQIFTGAQRPKKNTDWSKSSDMSLRQAFARRKKTSTPIEPELLAELIKRFPNFNSETQIFTGAQRPKKNTDWSKSSDMSLRQTVSNHKKTGKALEPELLAELIKRFPNFNSETQTFTGAQRPRKNTDRSKSTDTSLRQAFARRKKTSTPIEPELLAELIKRFPNFNSEKQIFTVAQSPKKNTDWTKSSDKSLRQAFAHRKKTGKAIEPKLLAELIKRFPNFDSEKQIFTGAQSPKENTDWSKSTDAFLRYNFRYRKKTGKALEPELLAELTKRFPNFDPEKQIFTGAKKPKKNTNWSKSPDLSLRQTFSNRKKANKPIEPELLAELTKRFPKFDPETQTFMGRHQNTDWSKSTDTTLRHAFSNRKKANKSLEPELLAELTKRFPKFDPETQTFTGINKNTDWSKSPDLSLRQAFARHKKAGKAIEPELLAELIKRFPNFNSETQTFTGAKNPKKNTDWSKSTDTTLRHAFSNRKKANKSLEPELLSELIKRFPNFDPETLTFTGKKKQSKPAKKEQKEKNWNELKSENVRWIFYARKKANKPLEPELLAELTKRFPNFDSEKQIFTGKQKKRPAPATKTPTTTNIQNQEYTFGRKNWTKAKNTALHMALSQRKKDKQPIEPELLAELIKRFPNFDPEKKIFIYKIDFTKSTDASIINIYSQRKAAKTPLEPELLTELAKRFTNFDPETQTLLPKANYKKATDAALRKLVSDRDKNNERLEPRLVDELTKRFPDFDPKSQKFCTRLPDATQINPVATQRTTKTTQNTQVAKQTIDQKKQNKEHKIPENKTWFPVYISDGAFKKQTHLIYNTELEQRILLPNSQGYANYDLCLFDCLSQIAVIRKTIYYYNKNGIIRENYEKTLHIIDCSCGIEYKKAQYLSSVKYDPATHALYINNKNSNYIIDADGAQFPITYTPRNLKTIEAMDKNKQTIIIINDTATTHNNFVIKPLQKAAQQTKLIQDLILAAHKQSQNPQPEQIPETTEKLFVFQDKVHQSLNNTYYNIYINDKRILSNCIDADIELLLSNKIMAVTHFTDNKKHIDIYDNTEKSLVPTQIDKYTKKYTYATDYSLTDKGIRLNMSNNTVTNIPFDKLNLPNKDYAFVITTQKHK